MRQGAFDELLKSNPAIGVRINHLPSLIVPAKVFLSSDWQGLACDIYLDDTQTGRDLILALRFGFLTGMSPGWTLLETQQTAPNGVAYRNIQRVEKIDEISFCHHPAQGETRCGIQGKVRLDKPSIFGPLLEKEHAQLQNFLDRIAAADRDHEELSSSNTKPVLTKRKPKRVPAKSEWQRVTVGGILRPSRGILKHV